MERRFKTVIDGLETIHGVRVFCAADGARTPVVSFTVSGFDSTEVALILYDSWGIVVRPGLHCAPSIHRALGTYPTGTVRVSLSWFTTDEDVQLLLSAVDRIASAKGGSI